MAKKVVAGKITLNAAHERIKKKISELEAIKPKNVHHENILRSQIGDLRQQILPSEEEYEDTVQEPTPIVKVIPNPQPTPEPIKEEEKYSLEEIAFCIENIFTQHPEWNHSAITAVILQELLCCYGRPKEEPECPF